MKSWHPLAVIVAVAAFAVSLVAAGKADREKCRGAVIATRISADATIGDALARIAPGGRWSVDPRPGGTRGVRYVAAKEEYAWVCSPQSVPLVEAETESARALTPWSEAP